MDIAPLALRLKDSLLKVYADKKLRVDLKVDHDTGFHGDEGDLMELLGNVLDNACKWADEHVRVRAGHAHDDRGGAGLTLRIDDDGPGIPADKVDAVLTRGVRADATTPGHGIGLAVVRDIVVEAYGGEVTVGASDLGGVAVTIRIPPH